MLSRTRNLAFATLLCATFSAPLWAQTAAPQAPAKAPAAQPAAKTPTPQQQRMSDCNKSAEGKKGDDRKTYMSTCLRGEAAAPAKTLTPQQQRMKDCNAQAATQSLSGDTRKTFMSTCLKNK